MLRRQMSVLGLTLTCQWLGASLPILQAQSVDQGGDDRPSPEAMRVVRYDDAQVPPAPQVKVEPLDPRSILARRHRGSSTTVPGDSPSAPSGALPRTIEVGPKGERSATETALPAAGASSGGNSPALSDSGTGLSLPAIDETAAGAADDKSERPTETQAVTEPQELDDESTSQGDLSGEQVAGDSTPELTYGFLGNPVSPESLDDLRRDVRRTLIHYHQKSESASDYSPWGIMHALIAYGADTEILAGRRKVNAIGWLCWNGTCRGQQLLRAKSNRISAGVGVGLQGHEGQFLAMLAQSHVPADFELRVGEQRFTVADLIKTEQETCRSKTELTFKLIAFSHYLGTEATWKSNDGEQWDMPRLIREEIAQPVLGAACGGTHRLMGLSYAVAARRSEGLPMDGEFHRAEVYLHDFQQHAIALRNRDGSFSTKWLERREAREDEQRRVQTTGHILEWLVYSLPEEQLRSPELVRTVKYLNDLMWEQRSTQWEIGPKGHALHALNLYDQKVFGARIGQGGPRLEWR